MKFDEICTRLFPNHATDPAYGDAAGGEVGNDKGRAGVTIAQDRSILSACFSPLTGDHHEQV
jgi:hypothetical protein